MALTKFNFNSFDLTSAASKGLAFNSSANGFETAAEGSMTLIKTLTASSSSTISFVNGSSDVVLDNTFPVYMFKYINIHTNSDQVDLTFNGSDDTSSHSYDVTKTSSYFEGGFHTEGDEAAEQSYLSANDLAQGTGFQPLGSGLGSSNDENCNGELFLFNPSSTTFVKHFIARTAHNYRTGLPGAVDHFIAGYFNTTSAITAIQFKMESGNIDAGTFKLYGIKDS